MVSLKKCTIFGKDILTIEKIIKNGFGNIKNSNLKFKSSINQ